MAINPEFVREVGVSRWLRRNFVRQLSKRLLRKDNTIVLPTGLPMRLPKSSKFATEVFITQSNVDWGSEELFTRYLEPTGVVLDVGANIGYYSLYVLPRVSAVHAFEPDPRALAALRSNLDRFPNAHAYDMAVSDKCGRNRLLLDQDSETSHLLEGVSSDSKELHEIEVTTIAASWPRRNCP